MNDRLGIVGQFILTQHKLEIGQAVACVLFGLGVLMTAGGLFQSKLVADFKYEFGITLIVCGLLEMYSLYRKFRVMRMSIAVLVGVLWLILAIEMTWQMQPAYLFAFLLLSLQEVWIFFYVRDFSWLER